jgi:transposase
MANADKIFLNKIIKGDETWCFPYDPETKRQSSEWVGEISPRPKKLEFQRSCIKTMLTIFDSQGIVHKEFIPEGKTVNAEFYKGAMDCLLKRIHWVRPAAFCSRDFFLLQDNASTHKAASVCQILTQKNVTNLYHPRPPYSPDLSRPNYFLFPKLKMKLKGLHFADVAEIQEAVTDELKNVQKEEFSAAFQKLYDRAKAYIYASGAYFELKKGMCVPHVSLI